MSATVLIAETGRPTGSPAARRLRAEGVIPAVVYGQGMAPIQLAVGRRDLRLALSGAAGTNTLLDLTVNGKVYPAIIKDIQRHPVKRTVSHIDFLQVNLKEDIVVSVPVRIEGEAKAVLSANGFVDLVMNEIEISTTPANIPDEIVIDVTDFTMDTMVSLGDVPLPKGVVATGDSDAPVVVTVFSAAADDGEGVPADGEAAADGDAAGAAGDGAADAPAAEAD